MADNNCKVNDRPIDVILTVLDNCVCSNLEMDGKRASEDQYIR